MHSFLEETHAAIHFWPWSVEVNEESEKLTDKRIDFPFYGSPVVTLSDKASLFIPSRMERFKPLGCPYDSKYQVYETPHGVLAGDQKRNMLKLKIVRKVFAIAFHPDGASGRYLSPEGISVKSSESPMARTVLSWFQVFDDLIHQGHAQERQLSSFAELSWQEVLEYLSQIATEIKESRMAVIVRIAEKMRNKLPLAVASARKILLRHRDLVPTHRVQETDVACLRWYIRQPGESTAEKAGNKQRLLAVVRREFFNTLENQVLKDFAVRCKRESVRYLKSEVRSPVQKRSSRAMKVQGYKRICELALTDSIFEQITKPSPGFNPNYVLQNDIRYKEVWRWYSALLKREQKEDSWWDWQPRTWADIARLLICSSLELLCQEKPKHESFLIKPLFESKVKISLEQETGCRIRCESLPGPFLISKNLKGQFVPTTVLEVIHPDLASKHPISRELGRLGSHLTLVFHSIGGKNKRKKVLAIWGVNTAASTLKIDFDHILSSAKKALSQHYLFLSRRRPEFPLFKGLVLASSLRTGNDLTEKESGDMQLLEIAADPRLWRSSLAKLSNKISHLFASLEEDL